jgi:hypothetical protein
MSNLAHVVEGMVDESTPVMDEPAFPSDAHQQLYRNLVERMEVEATVLPGMGTAVGLMIRRLARDYVWGLVADQAVAGDSAMAMSTAKAMERDRRMIQLFKMLLEQAGRADLEHALRTEFVLGLIAECIKVLDGEMEPSPERTRLKELLSGAFVTYTESVQGRIGR